MPELRKDPVSCSWVILTQEHPLQPADMASANQDPLFARGQQSCPLCPGNEVYTAAEVYAHRPADGPGAMRNAPGWSLRVVPHKFPVLGIEGDLDRRGVGLYDRMNGIGAHEVLIETPDHERPFSALSAHEIEQVLWAYRHRLLELRRDRRFRYLSIFKAHGQAAGARFGHSHSQLIAMPIVPQTLQAALLGARRHYRHRDRCLFCDVLYQELAEGRRLVHQNASFVALCPYASKVPFEVWILPRQHVPSFEDGPADYGALSAVLRIVLRKLHVALDNPSYSFALHNLPYSEPVAGPGPPSFFHWHIQVLPVVMPSSPATISAGCHINPTPPEEAAHYLRELEA